MWRHEPHHTPADVWALGMSVQWCLALGDPLADANMTQLEERLCAMPQPRIPVFEVQDQAARPTWTAELEPLAAIARQCCCADPAERLSAQAVMAALSAILPAAAYEA